MTGAAIPEGSVVITPIEMYREMQATHQAVRDVSGKLDGALEAHTRRLDDHDKDFADHEERIRHVEQVGATKKDVEAVKKDVEALQRWRWRSAGIASAVSAVSAAGGTALIMRAVIGH
jgi:hypothetical protein